MIQRRKTRSSDFINDWSTLKEMNRDLQPKLSRKRPVAELTPSKKRSVLQVLSTSNHWTCFDNQIVEKE